MSVPSARADYSRAMLWVCEGCGLWAEAAEIGVTDEPAFVCPHCGHHRPFVRQPLFQVTGASGAGKTRVARDLPAALPECAVFDQDLLLDAAPWVAQRRRWLRIAGQLGQGDRSTVLLGTQIPEHYDTLPERACFATIHFLALVCEDAELERRLRARPEWRRSGSDESVAEMLRFNGWLKTNAAAASSPMALLDTTRADPGDTVAAVADWVRERLGSAARKPAPSQRSEPSAAIFGREAS